MFLTWEGLPLIIFDASILTKVMGRQNGLRGTNRRGLAPVEMALVLLPLMLVMSIIMVYGYATVWKLRGETVARDSVWRSRVTHTFPGSEWRVEEWPEPERMGSSPTSPLNDLLDLDDPVLNHSIIAGEIPEVTVDTVRLDMSKSVKMGVARMDRATSILPAVGHLDFRVENELLNDRFQAFWNNNSRRFSQIYTTDLDIVRNSGEYRQVFSALVNDPVLVDLEAMDDDRDWDRPSWWKDRVWIEEEERWQPYHWPTRAPNFYPQSIRPPSYFRISFDWLDRDWIELNHVSGADGQSAHVGRIRDIPRRLATTSILHYEMQLEHPCIPASVATELAEKIGVLELF